jgi:hypothetical protein
MGRKSTAKKKRRIQEQKKEESEKKIKEQKKTSKKKKVKQEKPVKERKPVPKQKIFGGLLTAIMLTLFVYVSMLLFSGAFGPTPLAEILPEEQTVAFLEINTNIDHTQLVKAKELLHETTYSIDEKTAFLEDLINTSVDENIKPWLGRQLGLAEILYSREEEGESLATVYFVETIGKQQTESTLKMIAGNNLSEFENTGSETGEISKFTLRNPSEDRSKDKQIYTTFIDSYLVIAPDTPVGLDILLKAQKEETPKIASSGKYEAVYDKTPFNKIAFIYLNFDHELSSLMQKYGVYTESKLLNSAVQPFALIFNSEGLALTAKDNYFEVEAFMSLEESFLGANRFVTYKEDYDADLTQFIPVKLDVFWGGESIERQVKRIITLLSEGNDTTNEIFEGVLNSYTEKYFGSSVSLIEDIYPLVQNEFALGARLEGDEGKDKFLLILELSNPTEDAIRLQKIANNFISSGAVFEPHIEEHELPDGTVSKEIVATPEELIKSESKYNDIIVYEMETESGGWGVYYTVFEEKAFISTNKEYLEASLNLAVNGDEYSEEYPTNIKDSPIYDIHIAPALSSVDEVAYFDVTKFWPESELIKSLSTGKEYLKNGVKAYYYIHVE